MDELENVIFPVIGLLFLLLGIILIVSIIFSGFNPYDQIAVANAEKLKAAIDQACLENGEVELGSFELKQNTPPAVITGLFTILPRWLIRSSGDPNYVLYYEAFPPAEAVGWEVYHDFQTRLIAPLPEGRTSVEDVEDFARQVLQNKPPNSIVDSVLINNIMLTEAFSPNYILPVYRYEAGAGNFPAGEFQSGGPTREEGNKFFGYGNWKDASENTKLPPPDAKNIFQFKNYLGLTPIEKTAIKYQPCGPRSLCLKTRSSVQSFPLKYCNDIKAVQLIYDAKNDVNTRREINDLAAIGVSVALLRSPVGRSSYAFLIAGSTITVAAADLLKESVVRHIAFKSSDFYMVSPCSLKDVKVVEQSCTTTGVDNFDWHIFHLPEVEVPYTPCSNVVSYPLYSYDPTQENPIVPLGAVHYTCVESIGTDNTALPEEGFSNTDRCIQIKTEKRRDGYCWTPNPYKPSHTFWERVFNSDIVRERFTSYIGLPVNDNTGYIPAIKAVVLHPTQTAEGKGRRMFEALDRKWWWGWP